MDGYSLVMPFIDGSETYVLGFEVGQIWQRLQSGELPEKQLVHTANINQLKLVAEHYNSDMFVDATDVEEWSEVTFTMRQKRLTLVPNKEFRGAA